MLPQPDALQTRLLVVDPQNAHIAGRSMLDLPALLRSDDLLIVNDAATLPASLRARTSRDADIELRLLGPERDGRFSAIVFGAGDWHTRTEDRAPPPALERGDVLRLGPQLTATVVGHSLQSPRWIELCFEQRGDELWRELYAWGKPVQYAYRSHELQLWSVQTAYASRPWASEMPSAGKPLSVELLLALRARGIRLATLTHAAGLSATGDPALDRVLPLPERYDIPEATLQAIASTRGAGGRVIAVGTSVVRALEAAYLQGDGTLHAGEGTAHLRITPEHRLNVVDGLLTGIHAPEESHFELLGAFLDQPLLQQSHLHARAQAYREHELGDECLILSDTLPQPLAAGKAARQTAAVASSAVPVAGWRAALFG